MRIYMMTDQEGISGTHGKNGGVGHQTENEAASTRLLTAEVNAAVEGLASAGAERVIVHQAHPIDIETLHPRASLYMSGDPIAVTPVRVLDASFDAAVMIGMHAMIGAGRGYMDHSFNSTYVAEMQLNGEAIGEVGIEALLCGYFGVPVIMVAGDRAVCREAIEFLGGVETVITKTALHRYAAVNSNPTVVRDQLRATARRALEQKDRATVKRLTPPYTLRIEMTTPNTADVYERRGAKRLGYRTILLESDDIIDLWAQRQGWAPGVHNARFGISPSTVLDF